MRRIYKYPLDITKGEQGVGIRFDVPMPKGARILTVQMQAGLPTIWADVSKDREATRRLVIYGTGWDLPQEPGVYVSSVQSGPYVWHIYDQGER